MAVTITEDLIDGVDAGTDVTGTMRVRAFLIEGLTAGPSIWDQADAELAAQKGIVYASPHPTNGRIFVTSIRPKPFLNSRTAVKSYVTYKTPDFDNSSDTVVTFTCAGEEIFSKKFLDGRLITTTYTPPGQPALAPQLAQVRTLDARGILTFRLVRPTAPTDLYAARNKLNSAPWMSRSARSWRCGLVEISKILYRPGYQTTIQFELRDRLWDDLVVYTDPISGETPMTVQTDYINNGASNASGNGWARVTDYYFLDFNSLQLPVVDFVA